LERRIKAPGATLKAAPFRSAAAVQELPANANVLILIVTPHWLGVETPEGQRGWLPEEFLEQVP
jgi:predicted cobalt transporter CbtA